ncbi:taste receptor type 2 member 105-like [Sceloporus undulatus]|uniref:taste receptor type 2 member 105-like n=1 Tax=Sceloporus undulatus TaxID=8520 RepID=UPI001C4CAEE6|nr:taste receptor type 2 member 105-like [Sceloporus undulatus]
MSLLDILTWAILGILVIMALLGNGFIIAVNGHQWLQNKKIVTCNFLLTSLSTSRFLLQMDCAVSYLLYLISPELYFHTSTIAAFNFIWMLFNLTTLWCVTWLSVFYCVKVTNFDNCLFLWLKPRINMLAPRLLGISIVVSIVLFFPSLVSYLRDKKWCSLTDTIPTNASQSDVCNKLFNAFNAPQFSFAFINFSLTLSTSIFLLTSLWKHTRNLEKSGVATKDLSTRGHIKVMKFVLVSVFFYILYFPSMVIAVSTLFEFGKTERMISDILLSLYALVHSVILILTNPKLKEVAGWILIIRQ